MPFRAAARLEMSAAEEGSIILLGSVLAGKQSCLVTKYNEAKATRKFEKWNEMLIQSSKSGS